MIVGLDESERQTVRSDCFDRNLYQQIVNITETVSDPIVEPHSHVLGLVFSLLHHGVEQSPVIAPF